MQDCNMYSETISDTNLHKPLQKTASSSWVPSPSLLTWASVISRSQMGHLDCMVVHIYVCVCVRMYVCITVCVCTSDSYIVSKVIYAINMYYMIFSSYVRSICRCTHSVNALCTCYEC